MDWKFLLKQNYKVILVFIFSYFLSYFLNVYLANTFSPAEYGDFSVAIRIITMILPFALLGMHTSSNRFLSVYYIDEKAEMFKGFYSWAFRIYRVSALVFGILG